MRSFLTGAVVAAFVLVLGAWGYRAGMDVRERAWSVTRTVRYNGDIANAVHWGDHVLRAAESLADDAGQRGPRLTFGQILRGEGKVYADLLNDQPSGDFELDYPPLRLLTMSLWMRSVQEKYPGLALWPGGAQRWARRGDTSSGDRRVALATEEIADPLMHFNAGCGAAAAVLSFALVGLWVDRGNRRGRPTAGPGVRRPTAGPPTPLRRANGLLLYPISMAAFAYAAYVAVLPSPAPPPAVSVAAPAVVYAVGSKWEARVTASVDPQGMDARCHVEWGTTPGTYDHTTADQDAGAGSGANDLTVVLSGLPAGQTVHYRIVARNDPGSPSPGQPGRGTMRSDDATLVVSANVVQPAPPPSVNGAVWLNLWQWLGVALLFVLTCTGIRILPPEHRGWATGLLAATFVWFDPALLVDAHVWPQWEAWVLPPFLLAALLASLDWWLAAGLVMGVGAMFKGQFLIGSPVLILWPLLSMRWGAVARMLSGFALSAGLIVSQWLVLSNAVPSWSSEPLRWIAAVAVAAGIAAAVSLYRRPVARTVRQLWAEWRTSHRSQGDETPAEAGANGQVSLVAVGLFAAAVLAAIVTCTLLIVRRWPADAELSRSWAAALLLAVLVPPWLLRRRSLGVWSVAILAAAIWCSAWLYHGDWSWKVVGFEYGTRKFDHLGMSRGTGSNLGTLLADKFGWDTHDTMLTFRPPDLAGLFYAGRPSAPHWMRDWGLDGSPLVLDVRTTLLTLFGAAVLASGIGAAIQDRRSNPRFLAALVAPWMLMPCLLAQMMNRYTMWGAVLSSLLVGVSSGFGFLHVLLSLLSAGMIGIQLLEYDPNRSPRVGDLMSRLSDNDALVMLVCGLVVLVVAMTPGRSVRRPRRPAVARQGRGRSVRSYDTSTSVAVTDPSTTSLAGLEPLPLPPLALEGIEG
jgi:hypothetical protein